MFDKIALVLLYFDRPHFRSYGLMVQFVGYDLFFPDLIEGFR